MHYKVRILASGKVYHSTKLQTGFRQKFDRRTETAQTVRIGDMKAPESLAQAQLQVENREVYQIETPPDQNRTEKKDMNDSESLKHHPAFVENFSTLISEKLERYFNYKNILNELSCSPSHRRYFKLFFDSIGVFIFYLLYSILQEGIM